MKHVLPILICIVVSLFSETVDAQLTGDAQKALSKYELSIDELREQQIVKMEQLQRDFVTQANELQKGFQVTLEAEKTKAAKAVDLKTANAIDAYQSKLVSQSPPMLGSWENRVRESFRQKKIPLEAEGLWSGVKNFRMMVTGDKERILLREVDLKIRLSGNKAIRRKGEKSTFYRGRLIIKGHNEDLELVPHGLGFIVLVWDHGEGRSYKNEAPTGIGLLRDR